MNVDGTTEEALATFCLHGSSLFSVVFFFSTLDVVDIPYHPLSL